MKFTSIKIENFRQYKDITFDFTKTTPYDLHVIIAVNGAGKTNLLNAINWCLYGDEPHTAGTDEQDVLPSVDKLVLANRRRMRQDNKDAMQEAKADGEKYCTVKVCLEGEEGGTKYIFERKAEIDVEALSQHGKDVFEVREFLPLQTNIYGSADHTDGSYNEIRDMLLPQAIREYFFFDGDQLLEYFGFNSAKAQVSHLKNSIYTISQVSVVEKTRDHLIEREKDVAKKIKKISPDLDAVARDLEDARGLKAQKEAEIETLKGEIAKARLEIAAIEKILSGSENVLESNRRLNENAAEIKDLEAERDEFLEQRAMFIRKYFVMFMLYSINKDNDAYIYRRLSEGKDPVVDIEEMKASLDNDLKCVLCGEPLRPERILEFQEFVKKYESNLSIKTLSDIHGEVHKGTDISGYAEEKTKLFAQIKKKDAKIKKLKDENEGLYISINRSAENIKGLENLGSQKKYLNELIEQNIRTQGKYEAQLEDLKKKERDAEERYEAELNKSRDSEALARRQRFLKKSIAIISDVIDGIVNTVKRQMEEKTFELFQRFVWDAERFDHIELDDYFQLKIFDADTKQSCLRSCSAGEKELLALAFTLAVHDVSGYDNLLFIDTPVGRLSGINRSNFSKVLQDVSTKKQIILAFTDTEFSAEVADVFTSAVLSSKVMLDGNLLVTKKKGE